MTDLSTPAGATPPAPTPSSGETSPVTIVAVDGPAGSGKSSVSKEVARRLGILPESGPGDLKGPAVMQ